MRQSPGARVFSRCAPVRALCGFDGPPVHRIRRRAGIHRENLPMSTRMRDTRDTDDPCAKDDRWDMRKPKGAGERHARASPRKSRTPPMAQSLRRVRPQPVVLLLNQRLRHLAVCQLGVMTTLRAEFAAAFLGAVHPDVGDVELPTLTAALGPEPPGSGTAGSRRDGEREPELPGGICPP